MPLKSHSDSAELTTPTAALRKILLDASAELAEAKGDEADWAKNSARASQWIARLIPLWREVVSQNLRTPVHDVGSTAAAASASGAVGATGVVSTTSAASTGDTDVALNLVDEFLTVLAARVPHVVRDHERHAAIEKAKHEWEYTADALTDMVCLLNADGLVLRANRVVEHWQLGSVSGVIGKKAHAVLHPVCTDPECKVARGLHDALPKLRNGEPHEFEFYSPAIDQTLHLMLRPMRTGGDLGAAPRDSRTVLVVTDVSALRRAQQALENVNLNLESRVRLRTRELDESNRDLRKEVARREHAEQELRASRNNLALLSEQLIQAQEGERRRIALELHDSVGQSLSAIKYTLERALIMLQKPALGSPESVLTLAVQRIHETADGIRAISMNLRPQMLDNLGAASATSWFCRGFAEIYPTLVVRAEIAAQNNQIPNRISTHLFRCVQELLNNVAKHAQASTVWIFLNCDDVLLSLEVRDDGIGMPDQAEDPARLHGSGIRNLRERAEMTGGHFSLSSASGGGTSARIVWRLGADDLREDAQTTPT
ncbi:MAG TPA: ATP-binding protein [Steroidobacteraceae bacterium]|nr:ATP-binding protein [Steroidobacteraceae bacterium]